MVKVLVSWLAFTLGAWFIGRERSVMKVEAAGYEPFSTYYGPRHMAWIQSTITGIHLAVFLYAVCEWHG